MNVPIFTPMNIFWAVLIFIAVVILVSIKQIDEFERGVKFTLGKYSGIMQPGWRLIFPIFQMYKKLICECV